MLVLLAVGLVGATALFANRGRNLQAVLKSWGIETVRNTNRLTASPSPIAMPSTPRWPWLVHTDAIQPTQSLLDAEQTCRSLSIEGQEAPSFARSAEGGLECSLLRTWPEDATSQPSLFLQVRGKQGATFTAVRVKFNLDGGDMHDKLINEALRYVWSATSLPPDVELETALREKIAAREDFHFIAGYYALTFRREMEASHRYNLMVRNRMPIIFGVPYPPSPKGRGMAAKNGSISRPGALKGPRLGSSLEEMIEHSQDREYRPMALTRP